MIDVSDLRPTIVPKSDQLNAEQLLPGPITIRVTGVRAGGSDEQPVAVRYEGDDDRPYKPCKTMRKALVIAWGADGRKWVGRSMTLYCDPTVKFGGEQVGGIRISHLSDIEQDTLRLSLTATRGKKAAHTIKRLVANDAPAVMDPATLADWLAAIDASGTEELAHVRADALAAAQAAQDRAAYRAIRAAADARRAAVAPAHSDAA